MPERIFTYSHDNPSGVGEFYITKQINKAGVTYPTHWHDYYEFEIVLSGKALHTHNDTVSEIGVGCAYLMCYRDFHSMTALTDVELYKVHFKKETVSAEISDYLEFHTCNCRFTEEETQRISQELSELEQENEACLPFCERRTHNYIENLLITLLRKTSLSSERTTLQPPIHRAIVYLNENFSSHNLQFKPLFRCADYPGFGVFIEHDTVLSCHDRRVGTRTGLHDIPVPKRCFPGRRETYTVPFDVDAAGYVLQTGASLFTFR